MTNKIKTDMTKKFHKICENDLLYRVVVSLDGNEVTLTAEKLKAACDVKFYEDDLIKLLCYNLSEPKNIVISMNCGKEDTQKCMRDDKGMIKYFVTTSERRIYEFIEEYRENNQGLQITVVDKIKC